MDISNRKYYFQIDIAKGIAIISVIILHTIGDDLSKIWFQFHFQQAVPIFILIMSVNNAMSQYKNTKNSKTSILDLYSLPYFLNKTRRIIIPFLIVFVLSLLLGIYKGQYYLGPLSFIGYLPVTGPGNYFITLLFQFVFIFPLIFFFSQREGYSFYILLCAIDFLFQLMAPYIKIFNYPPGLYIYSSCILRYISLIGLGVFLGKDLVEKSRIEIKEYRYVLYFLPLSLVYLILSHYVTQPFVLFRQEWGTQNIISFPYVFVLFVILINCRYSFVPSIVRKALVELGRASYHIFLIQILFFGVGLSLSNYITGDLICKNIFIISLNMFICFGIGLVFFYAEMFLTRRLRVT